MFWEMCFRRFSCSTDGANGDVFVPSEQPGIFGSAGVRKRHSCWPFNQRNCRSIKFEPVPILSNDNAPRARVPRNWKVPELSSAETSSSIMESSRSGCIQHFQLKIDRAVLIFLRRGEHHFLITYLSLTRLSLIQVARNGKQPRRANQRYLTWDPTRATDWIIKMI